jgi:hypothetical protein
MGWELPIELERLIESGGLLRMPALGTPFELPSGSSGLHLLDPEQLFAAYLHLDDAIDGGGEAARGWLLFAAIMPHRGGQGYALKRGEGGAVEVGFYHEDRAATGETRGTLQDPLPGVAALIESLGEGLRVASRRGDRVAIVQAIRSLAKGEPAPDEWQKRWAQFERGGRSWDVDAAGRLRPVLRETDDEGILGTILKRIRADLEGRGVIDPLLASTFERGSWPAGYPGPDELLARLPAEGEGGLRGVARWCLSWSGVEPEGPLAEATSVLEALVAEGGAGGANEEARRAALAACAALAREARGVCTDPAQAQAFYARGLTWALGSMSAARVRHVASIALSLHRLARTGAGKEAGMALPDTVGSFGMPALFYRLSALVRGTEEEPPMLRVREAEPEEALPIHDALAAWIEAHEGSQRERLAAIEAEWTERIGGASEADRGACVRLLKKKINTKKLRAQRDSLLTSFE